jgi:hypothetical protein
MEVDMELCLKRLLLFLTLEGFAILVVEMKLKLEGYAILVVEMKLELGQREVAIAWSQELWNSLSYLHLINPSKPSKK